MAWKQLINLRERSPFANVCLAAIMMEDSQTGQRYLQVKHFISRGVPSSVMTFAVVVSIGYGLMRVVGF